MSYDYEQKVAIKEKLDFPLVAKVGQCSCNGVHFTWSSLERWSAISGPVNLKS